MLEGLCALKKISRTDEGRLFGAAAERARAIGIAIARIEQLMEDDLPQGIKKKYYN